MRINVKLARSRATVSVNVYVSSRVSHLKKILCENLWMETCDVVLYHNGIEMVDDLELFHYGVWKNSLLLMTTRDTPPIATTFEASGFH